MVEAVIRTLIGLCLLVLCVVIVLWVLTTIGIVIPAMAMKVIPVHLWIEVCWKEIHTVCWREWQ